MSIKQYLAPLFVKRMTKDDRIWLSTFLSADKSLSKNIIHKEFTSLYSTLNSIILQKRRSVLPTLGNIEPQNWLQHIEKQSLMVLPFSRLLITTVCQLHQHTEHQINIVINPKNKLPFIDKLNQLKKVSIITQSQAISLLSNDNFKTTSSIIMSCPELNPTNLKSGHMVSLRGVKYSFSMFEILLCLKGKMNINSFKYKQGQLHSEYCILDKDNNTNQQVEDINTFIYDCFESLVFEDKSAVFSWDYIKQHTVEQLSLGEIKMINRVEGLIRYKQGTNLHKAEALDPMMQALKELKTKAHRISGVAL